MIVMMSSFLWRVSPLSSVSHRAALSFFWRVKCTRTHSLSLLFLLRVRDLNTHLTIDIVGTGCFSDGLLLSQSRQRIICLNTLRTILQVSCFACFLYESLSLMYFLQFHVSFVLPYCFWLHISLRWRLLTSLARSLSTLVSSTTVIRSSPIGWTCCHGTSSRTKKQLVKKGINSPIACWASQIGQ